MDSYGPIRGEYFYDQLRFLLDAGGQFCRCRDRKYPFDKRHKATLQQLLDHDDNIAFKGSTLGFGTLDYDSGNIDWFTDILRREGISYEHEASKRGGHVIFPISKTAGINMRWQNEHGEGEIIYTKMAVIRDIKLLLRLYGKARKSNAKAHWHNVVRHIGAKEAPAPAPTGNPSKDKANLISQLSKLQKRDDGGYFYGNRNNQLNSDVWYDRLKGGSGWARRLLALDAHKEEVESIESWTREVDYTYRRTASQVDAWKQCCMTAATCVSTTDAFQRVLGAMWAIAKTTSICWASHETISITADCSIKSVQRAQKLFHALKIIRFKGYHGSGTCKWSFADLGMSDKPFYSPEGSVVSLVRRLVDVVDSVVLSSTTSTACLAALRRPDRAPP